MKYNKGTSGIELIAIERDEQISKHGFSLEHDKESYQNGELVQAAKYCLGEEGATWPENWDQSFKEKIDAKDQVGKLIVAGALFVAEDQRLEGYEGPDMKPDYTHDMVDCAMAIDSIIQNAN